MNLRAGALSRLDSIILAISGTAPANVLANSTPLLLAAVGMAGPGSIVVSAIVMFGISLAFMFLNTWRSDAGASYAWVGRTLSPSLGFLCGWSVLVATTLFMVIGSVPAAAVTLTLVAPKLVGNVIATTVVGAIWFVIVDIIIIVGIRATAEFQKVVTSIEVVALFIFALIGIFRFAGHPANAFGWHWFSPFADGNVSTFMAGAIVAIFYFWGWDVTANLTEETQDRANAPGQGGFLGMFVLLALFVLSQTAVQLVLTPKQINDAGANVLAAYASAILPSPWDKLALLVVIVSTIGTLQTSLLQASRTLFSMARDAVIGDGFGRLHPEFQTPWLASVVVGAVGLVLFAGAATSSGVLSLLNEAVNAIGIQIAFYYGLAGIACARYYRATFAADRRALVLKGIWPVASAAFLAIVALFAVFQAGLRADLLSLGALAAGVYPLIHYRRKYASAFYVGTRECAPQPAALAADPSAA